MNKYVFVICITIAIIPFTVGLILSCIVCVIPFSIRGKSIKIGIRDSIDMFNDIKSLMV